MSHLEGNNRVDSQNQGIKPQNFHADALKINASEDTDKIFAGNNETQFLQKPWHIGDCKHKAAKKKGWQISRHQSSLIGENLLFKFDAEKKPKKQRPAEKKAAQNKQQRHAAAKWHAEPPPADNKRNQQIQEAHTEIWHNFSQNQF